MPNHQELFRIVLEELNAVFPSGYKKKPLANEIANKLNLSNELRTQIYESGRGYIFEGRVGWAITYLSKAGLIDKSLRGINIISEEGKNLLATVNGPYDNNTLKRYRSFLEFVAPHAIDNSEELSKSEFQKPFISSEPPLEYITKQYAIYKEELAEELLDIIISQTPAFFERLIIDLLIKMGYGGSYKDAAKHLGKSGDEGIDGIISEDRLGLGRIYLQAKKYDRSNAIGRPAIQSFAGALSSKGLNTKGVFITTSKFTNDAKSYVSHTTNIVLIDGKELTQLMMEYGLGVSTQQTFVIQKIDTDYFED
jgi:restriction system protein